MTQKTNHKNSEKLNSWNENEKILFEQWLKEDNNAHLFNQWSTSERIQKDLIRLYYLEQRRKKNLKRFMQALEPNTFTWKRQNFITIAASILLVLGLGGYMWINNNTISHQKAWIPTNYDDPTLHMMPSMEYQLNETCNNIEIMGVKIQIERDRINYTSTNPSQTRADSIPHNTLKVPRGRMYEIKLADGTRIKLNSDSELSYPISFDGTSQRTVYLTGEAYFEVKADSIHPFIVQSPHLNVQVYGTKFNLKSYKEDLYGSVMLEEGKLDITNRDSKTVKLLPGDYVTSNILGEVTKESNIPATNITCWQENKFFFQNQRLLEITKDLERKFDVH